MADMTTEKRPDVLTASPGERFATSPAQAGLWFASAYGDDPTAYNQPLVLRLPVALDHDHLLEALDVVHHDHMALRTTFETDSSDDVRQVVHERLDPIVDVLDCPDDDPEDWVSAKVAEVATTVFDLEQGPLARVRHLRLARRRHEPARVQRPSHGLRRHVLEAVPQPARGGLHRRRERGAAGAAVSPPSGRGLRALDRALAAASRVRAPCATGRTSSRTRRRPAEIGLPGQGPASNAEQRLVIDEHLTGRVREFCSAEGVTTSMFFTALFFVLLHRQTAKDDVLLGMPVTVREGPDAEVVGHLTNTVVLRHRLEDDATTRDVLQAVKRDVLDALRHRHAPLEAVVQELRAAGDQQGGTADLFNAMITVMPASARNLDLRAWG